LRSGKRTSAGELILPRMMRMASVNPQDFRWEKLWPPVFAENFNEIRARLEILPPASLRPRRLGESLFVCPIQGLENVRFDSRSGHLQADLIDAHNTTALLQLPYASRGSMGFEQLCSSLQRDDVSLCYLSANATVRKDRLVLKPLAAVFEEASAETEKAKRFAVLPAVGSTTIDEIESEKDTSDTATSESEPALEKTPFSHFLDRWHRQMSEEMLLGIERISAAHIQEWTELSEHAEKVGLIQLASLIKQFAVEVGQKETDRNWSTEAAVEIFLRMCIACQLSE